MSYKFYYSSVKGTSHEKTGTLKQDDINVKSFIFDDKEYLISAVADGAGTAKYSNISSNFICKFLVRKMTKWISINSIKNFNKEILCSWIEQWQKILTRYIKIRKLPSTRDFATTILFSVLSDEMNIFAQIGDGSIVAGNAEDLNCVFLPQKGEYANTTHFATEENFNMYLMFNTNTENIERVAMHTDGIEMISLIKLEKPSLGFFNPFFDALKEEHLGFNEDLSEELSEFLSSDRVNKRTNDDKTLIIIVKEGPNG